jgi:hypothetical protein
MVSQPDTSQRPAQLTVRRPPPGGLGDPYPITVWLDGERLAVLMPGESVTRETPPGRHRLKAFNTLLRKSVELDVAPGEEVRMVASNRAGFGTLLFAMLGVGPLYVGLERDASPS